MSRFFSLLLFVRIIQVTSQVPLFYMFYWLYFQRSGEGEWRSAILNAHLFICWALLHSLLARRRLKRMMSRLLGADLVRPLYNIFSGLTFLLVLVLWQPLKGILWQTEGVTFWLLTGLYIVCLAGVFFAARAVDWPEFLGISQILKKRINKKQTGPRLSTNGLFGYCRHPMYLFMILGFWIGPVMSTGRAQFAVHNPKRSCLIS